MNSVTMAAAVHEAAHAVAARKQNVGVVHAVAAEKNCEVRTCWRRPRTMAEAIDAHEALAIVDLSGPAAEQCYLDQTRRDAEWRTDERNASCRAAAIIRLRLGLAEDAELTTAERAEADALLADLRDRAPRYSSKRAGRQSSASPPPWPLAGRWRRTRSTRRLPDNRS